MMIYMGRFRKEKYQVKRNKTLYINVIKSPWTIYKEMKEVSLKVITT